MLGGDLGVAAAVIAEQGDFPLRVRALCMDTANKLAGPNSGSVKRLPPTLTLQHHFMPDQEFRPHAGARLNCTLFTDRDPFVPGLDSPLQIDRDSFAGPRQLGADFEIAKSIFLTLDLKKVWVDSDLTVTTTRQRVSSMDIAPLLSSVGLGWEFGPAPRRAGGRQDASLRQC
ncbi:MAG TPA: OmpW family outer membrane protein [Burkholderiales bacterium]